MFYTNVSQMGNRFLHRFIDDDGLKHSRFIDHTPSVFVPSNEQSNFKGVKGENLKEISFSKVTDAKDYLKTYKGVLEIHGQLQWRLSCLQSLYPNDVNFDLEKIIIATVDIENLIGDNGFTKPEDAPQPITAITVGVSHKGSKHYYAFSCVDYEVEDEDVTHKQCNDETDLILSFLDFWKRLEPDVLSGWNCKGYDVPYLINRISKVLGEKFIGLLAPTAYKHSKRYAVSSRKDNEGNEIWSLAGIAIMDYMLMYKKFTFKLRERYSLDYIAYIELGDKKVDYSEHGNLDDLYRNDPQKYVTYNIKDVKLVDRLDDKMNMFMLTTSLAYMTHINYDDVFSQVRLWDQFIYVEMMKDNIVVQPKKDFSKSEKYEGAVVFDPKIGMFKWVVSFDLDGLYPHIMMQNNISIEKLVEFHDIEEDEDLCEYWDEYSGKIELGMKVGDFVQGKEIPIKDALVRNNFALSANGSMYKKDSDGVIPIMLKQLYVKRKVFKNAMLDAEQKSLDADNDTDKAYWKNEQSRNKVMQMAIKVCLNSCYGMIGNEYSRFYDVRIAEGITVFGQLAIRWVSERVNTELNKLLKTDNIDFIIAGDTDSFYFTLNPLVEKHFPDKELEDKVSMIDKFAEKYVQPIIHQAYDDLKDYMNSYEQKMNMSREIIASRGFWRAKKNYALLIHNSEGVSYDVPKMKIMGLESVRSSTPEICRNAIEKSVKIILTEDEPALQKFVKEFEGIFKGSSIIDISFPRGINDINKWQCQTGFLSRTPIHVKGSLTYNRFLDNNDLKMTPIRNGNKIKYIYLKDPNPAHCNVISYPDYLPDEFGLNKYIDYHTQYIKSYKNPIDSICECIGWEATKKGKLF